MTAGAAETTAAAPSAQEKENCPNPEFFQPAIVRQSTHVRNLFKSRQKAANITIRLQKQKKVSFP